MDKNYKLAKTFSLIPFISFLVMLLITIIDIVLTSAFPSSSFTLLIAIILFYMLLGWIPILVLGILGIVFSVKATKNNSKVTAWLVISILGIIIAVILLLLMICILYAGAYY